MARFRRADGDRRVPGGERLPQALARAARGRADVFPRAAADLYELAIGHPVETAAWAEGCGRTAVALDLLAGCGLLLLGALGLRVAARRAADPSASKRSRT
ncbi:hypothetical protein [Chenggangzhangella methanolivorans]|uniref:Uncharacterized protein n=1 Tax=Chenggangzhangella methanolivorans TaxID=1437009 RepID=A0A9E6RCT1_9HYPH|nr:hypothetical protein [Chenggangzhangella methanolivorans]QZO01917.1 hypothetical protein K6K41_11680 [Chenggangzhangella methanolivorans]